MAPVVPPQPSAAPASFAPASFPTRDAARALDAACAGDAPVLVAGPAADGTYQRAVVGVDFADASLRAAALAHGMLAPGGALSLVHVKEPLTFGGAAAAAWESVRGAETAERLRLLVAALLRGGRRDVRLGTATLVGDPADELLAYAARVGADLVACGVRGGRCGARGPAGRVATVIARRLSARLPACTVLVCAERSAGDADFERRQ